MMEKYLENLHIDFIQASESPDIWICFLKNNQEYPVGSLVWNYGKKTFNFEVDSKLCGVVSLSSYEMKDIVNFIEFYTDQREIISSLYYNLKNG